jgi:acyl-CoA synthetase (AMP-forming)/AMP-acid ligase II
LERSIYEQRGLKIHNFYGSSECGGIAYDGTAEPREEGAAAGQPMRNVGVRIDERGCVEVSGAAVGTGYWPEGNPSLGGGRFCSNDLGELVEGWVLLRGRVCDQINVAGRKVAPEVIERTLSDHPQVRGCVAFGVPDSDPQRGETIVACVATEQLEEERLRQFALSRLPAWQVPRQWWLVEDLPTNGRGKLSRTEWRRRYLEYARTQE